MMKRSDLNDGELWQAIKNDDSHAFSILYDRYWVRLYKTAFYLTRDKEISEDILHDVFINIWKRRFLLSVNSFNEYLLTAVRYQVYNRRRSDKLSLVSIADYTNNDGAYVLNEAEQKQHIADLSKEIEQYTNQLPKRCQEIFLLSVNAQLSTEEIADRLQISKRTVENQIAYARNFLRSVLKHNALFLAIYLAMTK